MVFKSLPLSDQVRLQILHWIRSGALDADRGQLPSETEIAEILKTSRSTVREALSQLENERIIIRRHGSRTYVNPAVRHLPALLNELLDPLTLIESQGFQAALGFQEHTLASLCDIDAAALDALPTTPAMLSRLLYLANQQPVVWLEASIPVDPMRSSQLELPSYISLRQFANEITGLQPTHAVSRIILTGASPMAAQHLGIPTGQPLLGLEDIHHTDFGQPVFISRSYFLPDRVQLHLLRNTSAISERLSVW